MENNENYFYESMLRAFALSLCKDLFSEKYKQLKTAPIDKLEKYVLEAKNEHTERQYYFLAGFAISGILTPELKKSNGFEGLALNASVDLEKLIGVCEGTEEKS